VADALLTHDDSALNWERTTTYPRKSITDVITNGLFSIDRQSIVTHWNKAAEDMLQIKAQDIVGKDLWATLPGFFPPDFYNLCHQAFAQDGSAYLKEYWTEMCSWVEMIIYHLDDLLSVSFKSSRHQSNPSLSSDRQPLSRMILLYDLYQYITKVTSDCLWEWNIRTEELFWIDGGHKRVFGYDIENFLLPQRYWESLLHPDDRIPLLERFHKTIAANCDSEWEAEYRLRKADGEYVFVHDRASIIYEDKVISRLIGATQDITARKLTERNLLSRQKEITEAALAAQEKERMTIGQELHDNLNQILGAAKLYVEMAKTDDEDRPMLLDKSIDYIMKVIEEIRRISKDLATPGLHLLGLFDSIESLVDELMRLHPIKIKFYTSGIEEIAVQEGLKLDLFRIVQEQMNNILKHSKATLVNIYLTRHGKELVLRITDNGKGTDLSVKSKGVGTTNILSRAEKYHGKIKILSKPGEGYSLKVTLPLDID
jgi:two-component system sensor histidine kinase UhpB